MISTSEIRISVVVDQKNVDPAVTATHKALIKIGSSILRPTPGARLTLGLNRTRKR